MVGRMHMSHWRHCQMTELDTTNMIWQFFQLRYSHWRICDILDRFQLWYRYFPNLNSHLSIEDCWHGLALLVIFFYFVDLNTIQSFEFLNTILSHGTQESQRQHAKPARLMATYGGIPMGGMDLVSIQYSTPVSSWMSLENSCQNDEDYFRVDCLLFELGLRCLPLLVAEVGVADFLCILLVGVRGEGKF